MCYKWFEFGKDENGNDLPKTIISREYSSEWKPGDEPYYPVNDAKNGLLYSEYKKLADAENNVIFGGRLGEYRLVEDYVGDKIPLWEKIMDRQGTVCCAWEKIAFEEGLKVGIRLMMEAYSL